jgi:hypothetical protein
MRYRVVQWATGNIGLRALREVIRHPSLDLAGVLTYDPSKSGVDAGELCGEKPTGVAATRERAAIHALRADCVLYMPRVVDVEDLLAFVGAGTNVVSTCTELYDGARWLDPRDRARVSETCARTGASVFATGSSPGFITDALPFALLSLQRRVDSYEIFEFANMSRRNVVAGQRDGRDVVRFVQLMYCTTELEPAWELGPTGWRVRVRGDAPLDVELPFPIAPEDLGEHTPAYTANLPVNAIPYVCAAAPGFLRPTDLPPITPAGPRASAR